MMLDMKYYVVTIAAIFIALGIGIFIGFNMNGQEIFLNQQQLLVEGLEKQFSEYRTEISKHLDTISKLKAENEKSTGFIEKAYYQLINGKLTDTNAALIQTTDLYYYNDIKKTIEDSGGTVAVQIILKEKLYKLTEENLNVINEALEMNFTKNKLFDEINSHIISFLSTGKTSDLLNFLNQEEYLQLIYSNGMKFPVNQIVLAGGSNSQEDSTIAAFDSDIIRKSKASKIFIAGAERSDVGYSYIPAYKNEGISTVDNIETLIGRISLVYILAGTEGHFGLKETAEQLTPFRLPSL